MPDWVKVGQWIRLSTDGRYAIIEDVLTHEQMPAWYEVRVRNWRHSRNDDVLQAYPLLTYWQPCDEQPEPRTAWERLLDTDGVDP